MRARDGTCRFSGWERSRFGDPNHIVHWAHGGQTKLDTGSNPSAPAPVTGKRFGLHYTIGVFADRPWAGASGT